jgi:hypothetical protein
MKRPTFSLKAILVLFLVVALILALLIQFNANRKLQLVVDEFAKHPTIEIESPSAFHSYDENVTILDLANHYREFGVKSFGVTGRLHRIRSYEDLSVRVTVFNERFEEICLGKKARIYVHEHDDEFGINITLREPLGLGVYHVRVRAFDGETEIVATTIPFAIRTSKELREGGIF